MARLRRPRPSRSLPAQLDVDAYKGSAAQCSARQAVGHPPLRQFFPAAPEPPAGAIKASRVELPLAQLPVAELPKTCVPSPRGTPRAAQFLVPTATSPAHRGTAASAGRRRRATPPAPLPLRTPAGIKPRDPSGPSSARAGRSWLPFRRNLGGPPPAGARGPNCKGQILSEGLSANQGHFGKIPILPKDLRAK
jgi:hypothetical protein